ncbi:hypothetical protein HispidOSU_011197, partial [Sigmodon hispidus]
KGLPTMVGDVKIWELIVQEVLVLSRTTFRVFEDHTHAKSCLHPRPALYLPGDKDHTQEQFPQDPAFACGGSRDCQAAVELGAHTLSLETDSSDGNLSKFHLLIKIDKLLNGYIQDVYVVAHLLWGLGSFRLICLHLTFE